MVVRLGLVRGRLACGGEWFAVVAGVRVVAVGVRAVAAGVRAVG